MTIFVTVGNVSLDGIAPMVKSRNFSSIGACRVCLYMNDSVFSKVHAHQGGYTYVFTEVTAGKWNILVDQKPFANEINLGGQPSRKKDHARVRKQRPYQFFHMVKKI